MTRKDKINLLTKAMQGQLTSSTLKQLTQPTRVNGLLLYQGKDYKPQSTDVMKATVTYASGQSLNREMTYAEFKELPKTVSKVLTYMPDNGRRKKPEGDLSNSDESATETQA